MSRDELRPCVVKIDFETEESVCTEVHEAFFLTVTEKNNCIPSLKLL